MKTRKNLIIGVLAVLVVGGIGWYLTEKAVLRSGNSPTPSNTSTESVATSSPIVLDYSKLTGKDRLYTEEEGVYNNLSEEEKELLSILLPSNILETNHLVSLYAGFALIQYPTVKAAHFYQLYDIKNKTLIDDVYYSDVVKSDTTLALINATSIYYYKPGMGTIQEVPNSQLPAHQTYLVSEGIGDTADATLIENTRIRISLFDASKQNNDGSRVKISEKELVLE